jgi:hypothetical protein
MRFCLCVLGFVFALSAADSHTVETLKGRLVVSSGQPPLIETADGRRIALEGDDSTLKVINDSRLNGFELEARGRFLSQARFAIHPIHTRALLAVKDGKRKWITYYCELCNIRTDIPGPCACCQQETVLELMDPDRP